jgi:hypothetical protein
MLYSRFMFSSSFKIAALQRMFSRDTAFFKANEIQLKFQSNFLFMFIENFHKIIKTSKDLKIHIEVQSSQPISITLSPPHRHHQFF